MIIEKGKVYGYSYDELKDMGKRPKDFETNTKVDNNELELSVDEIDAMFPNQYIITMVTKHSDPDDMLCFDYGKVWYFQCSGEWAFRKVNELNKLYNTDKFIVHRYFDARVDGDILWL